MTTQREALPVMTYAEFDALVDKWGTDQWNAALQDRQIDYEAGRPCCPECGHTQSSRAVGDVGTAHPLAPYVGFECGHQWRLENG